MKSRPAVRSRADSAPAAAQRIAAITLDERTVVRRNPAIEHERKTAISDLLRKMLAAHSDLFR